MNEELEASYSVPAVYLMGGYYTLTDLLTLVQALEQITEHYKKAMQ